MQKYSLIAGLLALAVAGNADAQARPVSGTVTRPTVNPSVAQTVARPGALNTNTSGSTTAFMAAGPYKLALHAQKKNNQAVSGADLNTQVGVSRNGSSVTIGNGGTTMLTGTVSGNHFTAAGSESGGGTLSLSGTTASNGGVADPGDTPPGALAGTFTLHTGSTTITGTFTMYPGYSMGPNNVAKIQTYGDPKPGSGGGDDCGLVCTVENWWAGLHIL